MATPSLPEIGSDYDRKLAALIEPFEGRVSYMYPDPAGNPTVGVGHLLPNVAAAAELPFFSPVPGKLRRIPATRQLICSAWAYTHNMRKPSRAIELSDEDIDRLFKADRQAAWETVRRTFDGERLPESALLALGDMAFNLGSFGKFPKLAAAVNKHDWKTAAVECARDVGAERNAAIRQLFLSAAESA